MGNICTGGVLCRVEDNSSIKDWIIILQANGEVMKLNHKVRAAELMMQYPHHFLCHASAILLRRKSKMLPPKALLQRGKIYLLLPFPRENESPLNEVQKEQLYLDEEDKNPLLRVEKSVSQGTTKFVISKQYLDRILSEKRNSKIARRNKNSKRGNCNSSKDPPLRRRSIITWAPALESIPESPLTMRNHR